MDKIKISIFGATGYTGIELYRRLAVRDDIEIVKLPSKNSPGKKYSEIAGSLFEAKEILSDWKVEETVKESDLIFTALPHGETFEIAKYVKSFGKKLIDIGSDYRLNKEEYKKWYGLEHQIPEVIKDAVYCIPELHRNKIDENTWLIANPGCYPTSIQLPLAPLIEEGLIETEDIIADSKSGVSGAGRGLKLATLYGEENENVNAYGAGSHRHKPEIERHLGELKGDKVKVLFTPHLIPMTRGIHSTIYATPKGKVKEEDIRGLLLEKYKGEKFIQIIEKGTYPRTKWVLGSNYCQIGVVYDKDTNKIILLSAIDNLVKGASGQGIQNMNILFGLEEDKGIKNLPVFP